MPLFRHAARLAGPPRGEGEVSLHAGEKPVRRARIGLGQPGRRKRDRDGERVRERSREERRKKEERGTGHR